MDIVPKEASRARAEGGDEDQVIGQSERDDAKNAVDRVDGFMSERYGAIWG